MWAHILTFALFLSHTIAQCNTEQSCVGQSLSGNVAASGYQSAFGPTTSFSGNDLTCDGASSCDSISFINANSIALCTGVSSCANTSIVAPDIRCGSKDSCRYSFLSGTGSSGVSCHGLRSCANSNISDTPLVYAVGMLSLSETNINASSSNLEIRFYASLSGYQTIIDCTNGYTCDLKCFASDACVNTVCVGSCNGLLQQNDTLPYFMTYIPKLFMDSNTLCMDGADNFQELYNGVIRMDDVCCRGHESCGNSVVNVNGSMVCSGDRSCFGSSMSGAMDIYCGGFYGCSQAAIENYAQANDSTLIYCEAHFSCRWMSVRMNNTDVVCDGSSSCVLTEFIVTGGSSYFYFTGQNSAEEVEIYCKAGSQCFIFCTAYQSCDLIRQAIDCTSADFCGIYCDTASGCPPVSGSYTQLSTIFGRKVHTISPTSYPSIDPTTDPTIDPTFDPTIDPTNYPSINPTIFPTDLPTDTPTFFPTNLPTTVSPTDTPTFNPIFNPTNFPTNFPTYPMETTEFEMDTIDIAVDESDDFVGVPCWQDKCSAETYFYQGSPSYRYQSTKLMCDVATNQLVTIKYVDDSTDCTGYNFAIPFGVANSGCSCDDVLIVSYITYSSVDCSGMVETIVTEHPESKTVKGDLCKFFPVGECKPIGGVSSSGSQLMTKCERLSAIDTTKEGAVSTGAVIAQGTGVVGDDDDDDLDLSSDGYRLYIELVVGMVLIHLGYWMR